MSTALRIAIGSFGRVALLDMDRPLVRHAHSHCHVLIKVEGHDTKFEVGGRTVPLTDEVAVLVNAGQPHSYTHQVGQPPTIILALYIKPRWLGLFRRDWTASAAPNFFTAPGGQLTDSMRRRAHDLAEAMLLDPGNAAEHERLISRVMIATIERMSHWREAGSSYRALARSSPTPDRRVARAKARIEEEPGAIGSMDGLARDVGLSRAQFFRLFERTVGLTPRVYLNMVRIERAVQQVAAQDQTIARISNDLGFSVPAHFSRFFHDHAGSAPTHFRLASTISDGFETDG